MKPTCMLGSWSFLSRFSMSTGSIFNSSFSMSPCSKNSLASRCATYSAQAEPLQKTYKSLQVCIVESDQPVAVTRQHGSGSAILRGPHVFFYKICLSGCCFSISSTLNRRLCMDVKSFVQEIRPRLISNVVPLSRWCTI